MKHLSILLFLLPFFYFLWVYMPNKTRAALQLFIRKHLLPLAVIVLMTLAALLVMFYGGAINIL